MKSKSNSLIDSYLSGKNAAYLVDAILEELPPLEEIRRDILRDLPGATIRFERGSNLVFIDHNDSLLLSEMIKYYERVYPELEFAPDAPRNCEETVDEKKMEE